MRTFREDMAEQSDVLNAIASYYEGPEGAQLLQAVEVIGKSHTGRILFAGMGSSYAASRLAAQYLWSKGIPAMYVEASELLHYGRETLLQQSLLVLISQSGESVEVVQLLRQLPPSVEVIGITNQLASSLAQGSSIVFPLLAGEESTTSSKTYTATIAVALLLCGSLAGLSAEPALLSIRTASRRLGGMDMEKLSIKGNLDRMLEGLQSADAIYLIGRGAAVTTAFQGALTFKELVKVQAESMEAAQFRHGPLETVNDQTLVIAFASQGATSGLMHAFVDELVQCGAQVIVIEEGVARIANEERDLQATDATTGELDEFFAALVDIYPVQMLANGLAERTGVGGQFKWITKVTMKQ